jgi:hypothetical protein
VNQPTVPTPPGHAGPEAHPDGPLEDIVAWSIEAEIETGHEATEAEAERGLVRRVLVLVAGFTLVIAGCFLLVLPGPGLITIAAGLALLSRDVPFARRWLAIVRRRIPESQDGEVAGWVIVASATLFVASILGSLGWVLIH